MLEYDFDSEEYADENDPSSWKTCDMCGKSSPDVILRDVVVDIFETTEKKECCKACQDSYRDSV